MNEKDFIILSILSKKKSISKDVLKLISSMNNKEKIKLIKYLYIMTFKYDIIPSDERIIKEICKNNKTIDDNITIDFLIFSFLNGICSTKIIPNGNANDIDVAYEKEYTFPVVIVSARYIIPMKYPEKIHI